MKLTRQDIITLFRSDYAEPQESFISNDDIMIYWWAALSQFYNEVSCEWTRSEVTTHTVADTPEYPLPADVRKITAVYNLVGTEWQRLVPLDYEKFLTMPKTSGGGQFSHYYQYRNQVGVYPTPSESSINSILTGSFTSYAQTATYFAFAASTGFMVASAHVGELMDVTAASGEVQTFLISANSANAVYCLPVNASTGVVGTVSDVLSVFRGYTEMVTPPVSTMEIWAYIENLKLIYAERPPLPNEDSARGMGALSDATNAETFLYYIPEEYLDTLGSYMLYRASKKDKLLKDAAFHRQEWEIGLAKANNKANHSMDDYYNENRSRGSFSPRADPTDQGQWYRTTHNTRY
ncbi:MAG TPA: hypothetical protein VMW58_11730 [Anaerolineae bacterium]|nr:hypothetical protein [Anaerolineae bacterium]